MELMPKTLCKSVDDYYPIVKEFLAVLKPNDIVFLNGEIGAGKTTFVQILGEEIGIKTPITSPTFNIIKTYQDILCHIDGYRLAHDVIEIDEYLNNGYYIFIEWSDFLDTFLKPNYIINIYYHPDGREIEILKGESC